MKAIPQKDEGLSGLVCISVWGDDESFRLEFGKGKRKGEGEGKDVAANDENGSQVG